MKTPVLFKSNDNYYLYSINKKQILIVSNILYELLKRYFEDDSLNYKDIKSLEIFKEYNESEIKYYFKKLLFLKDTGFLEKTNYKIKEINPEIIQSKFINSHYISFAITDKCNLRCKYCTYGKLYEDSNSSRIKKDLDFSTAKKVLDNTIIKNGESERTDEYGISFYGGEPLLKIELIKKIVGYTKNKCPKLNLKFFMTTNGTLLDRYMDFFVSNNFLLLISLDGNEKHNSYRQYKNGKPSFNIVFQNILKLKNKYPEYFRTNVEFNTVLHSMNNKDIPGLNYFFKENFNKVSSLGVIKSTGVNSQKKEEFKIIAGRKIKSKTKKMHDFNQSKIFNEYCNYKKYSLSRLKEDSLIQKNENSYVPNSTCIPFDVKTFITNEGNILPCEKVSYDYILGRIEDNNLDINFNKISKNYKNLSEKVITKCKTCYKIDCGKCMFSLELNSKIGCDSYISKRTFTNLLKKQISVLEENQ